MLVQHVQHSCRSLIKERGGSLCRTKDISYPLSVPLRLPGAARVNRSQHENAPVARTPPMLPTMTGRPGHYACAPHVARARI
eukprot:scaffold155268_cov42-Tisochrysis_lutea.AAC.1